MRFVYPGLEIDLGPVYEYVLYRVNGIIEVTREEFIYRGMMSNRTIVSIYDSEEIEFLKGLFGRCGECRGHGSVVNLVGGHIGFSFDKHGNANPVGLYSETTERQACTECQGWGVSCDEGNQVDYRLEMNKIERMNNAEYLEIYVGRGDKENVNAILEDFCEELEAINVDAEERMEQANKLEDIEELVTIGEELEVVKLDAKKIASKASRVEYAEEIEGIDEKLKAIKRNAEKALSEAIRLEDKVKMQDVEIDPKEREDGSANG